MKVLGITGSIATGKSTVTNYLKQRGYLVVDSDKLAYDALTIDEVCIKQTKNRFDLPAGPIDRKALGRIIFNETDFIDIYDPDLTFKGLKIIYDKYRKNNK